MMDGNGDDIELVDKAGGNIIILVETSILRKGKGVLSVCMLK